MKIKAALADSNPTNKKAGGKSLMLMVGECFSRNMSSTTKAPTATPVDNASCCAAETIAVARLILAGSISA
jgi:hypothetical protein